MARDSYSSYVPFVWTRQETGTFVKLIPGIMNQPHRTRHMHAASYLAHLTHLNLKRTKALYPQHGAHSSETTAHASARRAVQRLNAKRGGRLQARQWLERCSSNAALARAIHPLGRGHARPTSRAAASGAAGAFQSASGAVCSLGVQPRHAARARHGHETRNLWARLLAASASLIALSFASRSRTHRSTSARITS